MADGADKSKPSPAESSAEGSKAPAKDDSAPPSLKEIAQNPIAPADIPALLQKLQLAQNSAKEGKAPEDYKFWNTQPVPKFKEPNLLQTTSTENGEELPEGSILPDAVCKKSVKPEPEKLLEGFEWSNVDLNDANELKELYDLLDNHYVEDTEGSFRFNYSAQFLSWALKPPGWKKDWHIGVRTKSTTAGKKGKLVAFIAGVPAKLKVRASTLNAVEINFLAIHRKLRNKRLAPVLIKEVTRQCYIHGIYQALYTAGTLLPTPVSTCRYFHRSLDWEHLYRTGFSHVPRGSTELRQKLKYKLESQPTVKGFRLMKESDIDAVKDLLSRYEERFQLRPEFSREEIAHFLCSSASKDVVFSYVVEENGKVTDFISYYLLESTVLRSNKTEKIRAAYLFYYATEAAFTPKSGETLQSRLQTLVHNALITAKQANFHVFNALTLSDNPLFLKDQKFEPGDGKLHFYLFNWRTAHLPGGVDSSLNVDDKNMGGVGVVML